MKKKETRESNGVKEIARRARVSIGTVDRVLHNRTGVSEKTRDRINKIIEALNYQPNILARRLATRKLLQFAVLIPEISEESLYWDSPRIGILQAAAELKSFGIEVQLFLYDQNDKQSFIKQSALLQLKKPDALVLAPFFLKESIALLNQCKIAGIPVVFINSDIPDQTGLCYIGPNLFQSGFLAAQLMHYSIPQKSKLLVVNISKEIKINSYNRLLRKEEGFRAYFEKNKLDYSIIRLDIRKTDEATIQKRMNETLENHPDLLAVFVTNSRVGAVATALQKSAAKKLFLIGYDFLPDNNALLLNGGIDFLICHKPQEQGYKCIMTLYQHMVLAQEINQVYYMPIDIVSSANHDYYRN